MKKNKKVLTIFLVIMTFVLLGSTIYISTLLSSPSSPTQIQKTKAANVTYTRNVNLFPTGITDKGTSADITPTVTTAPTIVPTVPDTSAALPTKAPALLAQAPTLAPTIIPTKIPPTPVPTSVPTATSVPAKTILLATPTLQPLLAYKSTTLSPTVVPAVITDYSDISPSPTKKISPTGMQQLPDTGWVQISSVLFIVSVSTILFSLLF